jgi:N6-L-threonylcarbamoyladenine synthase
MFSYSGLKNAVRVTINDIDVLDKQTKMDICASFQKSAVAHITMKLKKYFKTTHIKYFAVVGGASANMYLKNKLANLLEQFGCQNFQAPLIQYCGDNAAMIGRCAIEQMKNPKEHI